MMCLPVLSVYLEAQQYPAGSPSTPPIGADFPTNCLNHLQKDLIGIL